MKRLSMVVIGFLFSSTLLGITGTVVAQSATVPTTISTCTNLKTGAQRILAKGSCAKTEAKGSWISFAGVASSKVLITCVTKANILRPLVSGVCKPKLEKKIAWTKSPNSTSAVTDTLCAKRKICNIGDIGPGGGMVFYVSKARYAWGKYLEAANPITWQGGSKVDPTLPWCDDSTKLITGTDASIGSGQFNARELVVYCRTGAGISAMSFKGGGKSDWFLPSRAELTAMFMTINTVFGFFPDHYWASTEIDAKTAWTLQFSFGAEGSAKKDTALYVRPVRAF